MSKKSGPSASKSSLPSANWLALQKVIVLPKPARKRDSSHESPRKRRKVEHSRSPSPRSGPDAVTVSPAPKSTRDVVDTGADTMKNGESLSALRRMIFGQVEYSDAQRQPGKYLALDCEMVGVGPEGAESVLARVSLVNFHGAVQLDEFVRPRERVVDYRTEFSGVRESDMVNAKPFTAVQAAVAALLTDRILVGHAVHNDLKALLLSHPHNATRDTQYYAGKFGVVKNRRIALRKLVQQEVGATIQGGEHSSVTDAPRRWRCIGCIGKSGSGGRRGQLVVLDGDDASSSRDNKNKSGKGKKAKDGTVFPGGGRKGVSSGLSTVVRRGSAKSGGGSGGGGGGDKTAWWKELGSGSTGSKGSMAVRI
ncbi:RNA exonuclease 4 [Mycena venus]|uniref:RNA exonuclease 4 n=1 Tax=Mycena venus TaxID=2733690 RepID=A0A8H6U024_9AGAR|nr:RNA exonuclease 4 [Mycena venus]